MNDKIEIRVTPEEEIAFIDDEIDDPVIAQEIKYRLDQRDEWAWCTAAVSAHYGGYAGYSYLGCCSYKDEEDFKASGYYEDMKDAAYENLIADIKDAIDQGERAKVLLTELGVK